MTPRLTLRVDVSTDAIYGDQGDPLSFPPAYQLATPFGTNIGPTNPAFFPVMADAEFDSFITLGMDGPALQVGALSQIGIDFDSWSEETGLGTSDGAVFFMDPDHGATVEPVVIAQLTVRTGSAFSGTFSAQGRSKGSSEDWEENAMSFSSANVGQTVSAGGTKAQIGH
jgi:hypothetical protein